MKVLIAAFLICGIVLGQAEHPMLGRPDHFRPMNDQPKAHPSVEDANQAHPPHPTPMPAPMPSAEHPMLGQNDGHYNVQGNGQPFPQPEVDGSHPILGQNDGHEHQWKGKHHKGPHHKQGHKKCNKHLQVAPPPTDAPESSSGMNTDALLLMNHPTLSETAPAQSVGNPQDLVIGEDNPTRPTYVWNEEEQFEEDRPRHLRRPRCRWGKIVLPIIGLVVIAVIIKKCNKRRRRMERMRQQMMQNMPVQPIVPVQRSLPDQLAYHRQEAQRIENILLEQHRQHQMQHPLNEPSFEPVYGQPIQPRY